LLLATLGAATPVSALGRSSSQSQGAAWIEDWIWAAVALSLVGAAYYVWRGYSRSASRSRLARFVSVVTALTFFLAVIRAIVVPSGVAGPWIPNLDIVTLAWLTIAIAGAFAQLVLDTRGDSGIAGLIGYDEQIRRQKKEIVATGASLLAETASVIRDWSAVLNRYLAAAVEPDRSVAFESQGNTLVVVRPPDWWPRLNQFVLARLTEASEWLGPTDQPRMSVWLANEDEKHLVFGWSTQNVGPKITFATFGFHEGIAGAAFTERMARNEVNPSGLPIFKQLDAPYPYKSMLVIPIDYGSRTIGVLCIDRMREEYFDPTTVAVMKALSSLLGIAIGIAESRNRLS
jgi:GAF domain-containing protein